MPEAPLLHLRPLPINMKLLVRFLLTLCTLLIPNVHLEELQQALRHAGLESSNLIVAIDYTRSNMVRAFVY
jgi:hypothetical protein